MRMSLSTPGASAHAPGGVRAAGHRVRTPRAFGRRTSRAGGGRRRTCQLRRSQVRRSRTTRCTRSSATREPARRRLRASRTPVPPPRADRSPRRAVVPRRTTSGPRRTSSGGRASSTSRVARRCRSPSWSRPCATTDPIIPATPHKEDTMNAVDLIVKDHRELQRMFEELRSDASTRPTLAPVMSTLLFAHSRAEESEVYPAARAAGIEEDVEHSQEEHLAADQLAERLTGLDPESGEFGDVLGELVEAVTHHLEEEEETVLPHMRERMSAEELDELGRRFLAARAEHLGEQPDDMTKAQLEQQARNIDLDGASGMSEDELKSELEEHADL